MFRFSNYGSWGAREKKTILWTFLCPKLAWPVQLTQTSNGPSQSKAAPTLFVFYENFHEAGCLSWGILPITRLPKERGFTSVPPQVWAGGTHGHGGGQGCSQETAPMLCSPCPSPRYRHGQALSPAQSSQTDCWKARNMSSPLVPLNWLWVALAKEGLCVKPKSAHLKSIIGLHVSLARALRGSKPTRVSLRYPLELDGYHTVYFCGVFCVSFFPWSAQGSPSHISSALRLLLYFLLRKEGTNTDWLITITMPCYAIAQTPEAWQTPRLGFLTFCAYEDICLCQFP